MALILPCLRFLGLENFLIASHTHRRERKKKEKQVGALPSA